MEGFVNSVNPHQERRFISISNVCHVHRKEVKVAQSCLTLCDPMPWNFPGQNTLSLLQGIFPTHIKPRSPFSRILYQLSNKESPRILEWVAYPFSIGSSQPKNLIRVSCIAGRFFTSRATWETQHRKEDL